MIQTLLNREIREITAVTAKMFRLTEEAVENAIRSLKECDRKLAAETAANDGAINELQAEIERKGLRILILRQPVASDFRFLSAVLHVITDVERIGDQAQDMANLQAELKDPLSGYGETLERMGALATTMTQKAFNAFLRSDTAAAREVVASDDEMDELFDRAKKEMTERLKKEESFADAAPTLLMIAKYCERIGDHCVNVAERTLQYRERTE